MCFSSSGGGLTGGVGGFAPEQQGNLRTFLGAQQPAATSPQPTPGLQPRLDPSAPPAPSAPSPSLGAPAGGIGSSLSRLAPAAGGGAASGFAPGTSGAGASGRVVG